LYPVWVIFSFHWYLQNSWSCALETTMAPRCGKYSTMESRPLQPRRFATTSNANTATTGNLNAAASVLSIREKRHERRNQAWSNSHERVLYYGSRSSLSAMMRFVPNCPLFLLIFTYKIVQSINIVDNPEFRELLLYFGQGRVTNSEIPARTCLTGSIIKTWKDERDQFHQEMKVCWTCLLC